MKFIPVLSACMLFPAASSTGAAIWTAGHGDFSIGYTAGPNPAFTARWIVGTGGDAGRVDGMEVYDAPYLLQDLTPRAGLFPLPSPDAARTGGSMVYLLPQDGTDAALFSAPFQGWAVSGIPSGTLTGNRIYLDLIGVSGPGAVSLWSDGAFGNPDFIWTSTDGLDASDRMPLSLGGHSHYNLAFTSPGGYQLDILIHGDLDAGGSVMTPATLNYVVIPEAAPLSLLGAVTLLAVRRKR